MLRTEIQHLRSVHETFNEKLGKLNKIIENRRQVQKAMIEVIVKTYYMLHINMLYHILYM